MEGMGVILHLIVTIYYGAMSGTMIGCLWTDVPHFFTVYLENRTWNDAREHCRSTGTQLLSISDQSDWEFWVDILNHTRLQEHRSVNGIYWTGLHAPDPGAPDLYFWENCTVPQYTAPAMYDFPVTYYQCGVMWLRREVSVDTFMDVWLKGVMCNETHPFICMENANETVCVDHCEELVVVTDQETCDTFCDNSACTSTYFSQLQMCHLIPDVYVSPVRFTICYLPSVDFTPSICSTESDETVLNTTDMNINVTDTVCMERRSDRNVTNSTVEDLQCMCLCEKLWTFLATPALEVINLTIEEKTEIIVKELTVEKKNTSISQRKYVSVMDYRPTSVGIGIFAGVIILSVIVVIIIIDMSAIWHELHHILLRMFIFLKSPLSRNKVPVAKSDVVKSEEGIKYENNAKSTDDTKPYITTSQLGSVGWFLRERSVYRHIEPVNIGLDVTSKSFGDNSTKQSTDSISPV